MVVAFLGRGIAANLLGDCLAHTETDFRFTAVFAHSELA